MAILRPRLTTRHRSTFRAGLDSAVLDLVRSGPGPPEIPPYGRNRPHAETTPRMHAHWRVMSPLACCNPPAVTQHASHSQPQAQPPHHHRPPPQTQPGSTRIHPSPHPRPVTASTCRRDHPPPGPHYRIHPDRDHSGELLRDSCTTCRGPEQVLGRVPRRRRGTVRHGLGPGRRSGSRRGRWQPRAMVAVPPGRRRRKVTTLTRLRPRHGLIEKASATRGWWEVASSLRGVCVVGLDTGARI
jgi:hypothetical protein